MKYPSPVEFAAFFKRLPRWAIVLVIVLLYVRFVIVGLWSVL